MDLETEWAGVLQRWANSGDTSVRLTENSVRQTNTQTRTESHDILGSSRYNRQQDGLERRSSNHNTAYETERKPSFGEDEKKRVERQTTRDRDWREGGGKAGGRARWSSVSRGSVSPGKENIDTGCRSRSATRSPTSRLYSSTVASRAKQINPVMTEVHSHRKSSTSSQRSSHSASSRGATPSRQDQTTDNYQTRRPSNNRSFSSRHRSSSQRRSGPAGRSSVSPPASSSYNNNNEPRKSSGSVKISLSSLKKASVESWDGGQQRGGKKKSISSVYIG